VVDKTKDLATRTPQYDRFGCLL